MVRKLLGVSLLLAFFTLVACGNSSTSSDECTDDPKAPGCEIESEPVVEE